MDEELLIEYVQQYKGIYNTKCKEYKDQAIRTVIWEEIGEKLKQPPNKCKDEWSKLRNAYVNAMKRRKNKKSGQAAKSIVPWKFEEQMKFLQPYMETRATVTNLNSPPNSIESQSDTQLESESDTTQSQLDSRSPPPRSSSSQSSRPVRNKTNLHELYDLMKSSHDLRLQKQQNKVQHKEMDETDLLFLSMSKALKKLPKLEQSKIKLDLHTAISQAEIRILEAQDQIRRTPINVTRQIISQPQEQGLQSPVHTSTSTPSFSSTSTFADQTRRTPINVTRQIISQGLQSPVHTSTSMLSFPSTSTFAFTSTAAIEPHTLESERQDSRLSAYYEQFADEDYTIKEDI